MRPSSKKQVELNTGITSTAPCEDGVVSKRGPSPRFRWSTRPSISPSMQQTGSGPWTSGREVRRMVSISGSCDGSVATVSPARSRGSSLAPAADPVQSCEGSARILLTFKKNWPEDLRARRPSTCQRTAETDPAVQLG
jgi:hypothetical protein